MIPKDTVDAILQATIIEDVVSDFVQLKKSGTSLRGLSPFTNEKTPSFYVVPGKGIFKCFSSNKGGSAVTTSRVILTDFCHHPHFPPAPAT